MDLNSTLTCALQSALPLLPAILFCSGCGNEAGLPVPPQYGPSMHRIRAVLDMSEGRPEQDWGSIEGGVLLPTPGADWRWVTRHPSFTFRLDASLRWDLAVRITAAGVALAKTGSQHAVFFVNGRETGSALLDHEGRYELRFPVDPATIRLASPVAVSMDFGPCMVEGTGPPLCVLLHSVGFEQAAP